MRHLLLGFLLLGVALAAAPRAARAAEDIPGAFKAPPKGTVLEYDTEKMVIHDVRGAEVSYELRPAKSGVTGRPNRKAYGWLYYHSFDAELRFDRSILEEVFPLEVGRRTELKIRNRRSTPAALQIFVAGVETVSVPAGDFSVWRIETTLSPPGGDRSRTTIWYSPELGAPVRRETELIEGIFLGRKRSSELINIAYPPSFSAVVEELPGDFKAPPVGTIAEYSSFKAAIRGVDGLKTEREAIRLSEDFSGKTNQYSLGGMVYLSTRDVDFGATAFNELFPLEVGKSVVVRGLTSDRRFWRRMEFEVLRTEIVTTRAGNFFTYVVERKRESTTAEGGRGGFEGLIWFAPRIGLRVKTEERGTIGNSYGLVVRSELVRLLDPEGNQLYPKEEPAPAVVAAIEEPTVNLTAADGQKLFDAGDYGGAVNAWFSAAQVGDALAMLKLGEMHEEGLGVAQSFLRAHLFYNLAAAKGDAGAREARNLIAGKMTAQTLARAQELAEGWPGSASALREGTR